MEVEWVGGAIRRWFRWRRWIAVHSRSCVPQGKTFDWVLCHSAAERRAMTVDPRRRSRSTLLSDTARRGRDQPPQGRLRGLSARECSFEFGSRLLASDKARGPLDLAARFRSSPPAAPAAFVPIDDSSIPRLSSDLHESRPVIRSTDLGEPRPRRWVAGSTSDSNLVEHPRPETEPARNTVFMTKVGVEKRWVVG